MYSRVIVDGNLFMVDVRASPGARKWWTFVSDAFDLFSCHLHRSLRLSRLRNNKLRK